LQFLRPLLSVLSGLNVFRPSKAKPLGRHSEMALIPACWLIAPIDREAWPTHNFKYRVNYHLCNLFQSAVSNVQRADHTLNDDDRKYLRLLVSFWRGWSATAISHMQDPAFCYLRHRYAAVGNLEPILDDMTYPEEVLWMPRPIDCAIATTLLLATPDRFYVYVVELDTLFDSGSTLKEVYEGLKKAKSFDLMKGSGWKSVEPFEANLDSISYFPDYDNRRLLYEIPPFVVLDMS